MIPEDDPRRCQHCRGIHLAGTCPIEGMTFEPKPVRLPEPPAVGVSDVQALGYRVRRRRR